MTIPAVARADIQGRCYSSEPCSAKSGESSTLVLDERHRWLTGQSLWTFRLHARPGADTIGPPRQLSVQPWKRRARRGAKQYEDSPRVTLPGGCIH